MVTLNPADMKVRITHADLSVTVTDATAQAISIPEIAVTAPQASNLSLHGGFRAALCYTEYLNSEGFVASLRSLTTDIKCAVDLTRLSAEYPSGAKVPYLEEDSLQALSDHWEKAQTFLIFTERPGYHISRDDEEATAKTLASYLAAMQENAIQHASDLMQRNGLVEPVIGVISVGNTPLVEPPLDHTWDLWARIPLQDRTTHVHISVFDDGDKKARQYELHMDPLGPEAMSTEVARVAPLSAKYWERK